MRPPVALRRLGFRVAHRLLRGWWFVRRPRLQGVKCVLTDRDRVLLVRHTYGRRDWDFPGGGVRRGEAPPEAARRELEEELGLRIDGLRSIGEVDVTPYQGAHDAVHCFHAEVADARLVIDPGELAAAEWFPREDLPHDVSRYVEQILAMAGWRSQVWRSQG